MGKLSPNEIESWAIVGISVTIIALRLFARIRIKGIKDLDPDDYLMVVVACLFPAECAMSYFTTKYGGTNNMPPEMRASLTDEQVKQLEKGAMYFYIGWLIYPGMLWILKFCMIFFYKRLTLGLKQEKALTWIAWICGITYIGGLMTVLFSCRPIQRNWQVRPDPGILCTQGWTFYGVTGITNLGTDLMLFCIPFPLIYRSTLPLVRKLLLGIMLGMGAFIMIVTILRHIMIFKNPYGMQTVAMWAVRETFVSCIVGNVPMIKPLVVEIFVAMGVVKSSADTSALKYSYNSSEPHSRPRRKKGPGMDTMLLQTGRGSQEYIMSDLGLEASKEGQIMKTTSYAVSSRTADKSSSETLGRNGEYTAQIRSSGV